MFFIFCSLFICKGQNKQLKKKVEDLKFVKEMPYIPELSGDSLFWTVVTEKLPIVPLLIEKLDDTTVTEAAVHNFGGYYTVADVAYRAIGEIIHSIPTLDLAEDSKLAEPREGYWGYWHYIRRSYENRKKFKARVKKWYAKHKNQLEWVEDNRKYRNARNWKFEPGKYPPGGYYKVKTTKD